jgi:tetratricopeptide (TPR) repeat protein
MDNPYLISYSRIDGRELSLRLHDELRGGPIPIAAWHDETIGIRASAVGWPQQIDEALKACAAVLFVMTDDSVKEHSVVADELYTARMYRKTIIPLVFEGGVTAPFLYRRLPTVSFVGDFDRGVAELRKRLAWLETPQGRIHSLEFQRASVERELGRGLDEAGREKIRIEIETIDHQIEQLRHAANEPRQAEQEQKRKIDQAIERETQRPLPESPARVTIVNRPPASPPLRFLDRTAETRVIGQFLRDPSKRLMTIIGRGGVGKTAMVCRILSAIERGESTEVLDGDVTVAGIVYLGSGSEKTISFEHFYAGLRGLLPENVRQSADEIWTVARDVRSQTDAVTARFTKDPLIVLFDNFEDLLDSNTQRIANSDVQQLLEALLELPQHAVKLIITTRETPAGLSLHRPERQIFLPLDEGLKSPYAEDLLRSLDHDGRLGLRSAPATVLGEIRERTLGIPRALEIFCAILNDPYSSLQEVLSDTQRYLPEEVVNRLSAEAFHRLDRTAQRVVETLAVFGRPVIPEAVDWILQAFEPAIASEPTLRRLVGMYLVRRGHGGRCFLHPVDQAYARSRIPDAAPSDATDVPETPYTLKTLTRRAAEYFRMIRTEESTWRSLSDLGPQLAEFDLLIQAGADVPALDVLDDIIPYLDRWGYRRQIARMAEQIRVRAEGAARARVAAAAGDAYRWLEHYDLAIERYEEALDQGPDVKQAIRSWWTLQLGYAHLGLNDTQTAARLFNTCLEPSPEVEPEIRVHALIGLGSLAKRRSDPAAAEVLYLRALDIYVPSLGVDIREAEGEVQLSLVETPTDLAITDPASWHFLDRLTPDADADGVSSGPASPVVLFGVRKSIPVPSEEARAGATAQGEGTIEVFPLQVNSTLAGIWMSLARLYFRWDRMAEAHAACLLAAGMHVQLEDDNGTLDAIDLLRNVVSNFSRSGVDDLLADLRLLLERAQQTGNRELTARILQTIADSNLAQERPADAELAYSEMRRVAIELEDGNLDMAANIGLARVMRVKGETKAAAERLETLVNAIRPDQLTLRGDVESEFAEIDVARYDYESAARHFEAAAGAYEIAREDLLRAAMQRRLASLDIANRRYPAAIQRLERVVALTKSTEIPSAIASALAELAGAYSSGGNRAGAVATAQEALQITDKIDVPPTRAAILLTLADVLRTQRQFDAAKETSSQARDIYRRLGDIRGEIATLQTFATIYSDTRNPEAQLDAAREAAQLADALPDPEDRRQARMAVALALADANSAREAIELMEEVVRDRPTDALAIGNLGWVLFAAGEYQRSISESQKALDRDHTQAFVMRNLGHAYLALRKPDEAEKTYRRAIRERRGGEDFHVSIQCVQDLLAKFPDLPRGQEMLALLESAQRDLEQRWQVGAEGAGV